MNTYFYGFYVKCLQLNPRVYGPALVAEASPANISSCDSGSKYRRNQGGFASKPTILDHKHVLLFGKTILVARK